MTKLTRCPRRVTNTFLHLGNESFILCLIKAPTEHRPEQTAFRTVHCYNAVYENHISGKLPLDSHSFRLHPTGTQRRTDFTSGNPNYPPFSMTASALNLHWCSPFHGLAPWRALRWQGSQSCTQPGISFYATGWKVGWKDPPPAQLIWSLRDHPLVQE